MLTCGGGPRGRRAPARPRRCSASCVRRLLGAVVALFVASIADLRGTAGAAGGRGERGAGTQRLRRRPQSLNQQLHLDRRSPAVRQLARRVRARRPGQLLRGLAQGSDDAPICPLISGPLKNSFILAAITALLMIPLSLGLGVLAAVAPGSGSTTLISLGSLAAISLPEFVIGIAAGGRVLRGASLAAAGGHRAARRRPAQRTRATRAAGRDAAAGVARGGHPHGARRRWSRCCRPSTSRRRGSTASPSGGPVALRAAQRPRRRACRSWHRTSSG